MRLFFTSAWCMWGEMSLAVLESQWVFQSPLLCLPWAGRRACGAVQSQEDDTSLSSFCQTQALLLGMTEIAVPTGLLAARPLPASRARSWNFQDLLVPKPCVSVTIWSARSLISVCVMLGQRHLAALLAPQGICQRVEMLASC